MVRATLQTERGRDTFVPTSNYFAYAYLCYKWFVAGERAKKVRVHGVSARTHRSREESNLVPSVRVPT